MFKSNGQKKIGDQNQYYAQKKQVSNTSHSKMDVKQ